MDKFIEYATRVVGIPSQTEQGNEELYNFLEGAMREFGLHVVEQQVFHSREQISKRQFNVIGFMGDTLVDRTTRKGLLLLSHLDTGSPGILNRWTESNHEPFLLKKKGDDLIGLGVADCKLDFLCKLFAINSFRDTSLKHPVYIAGTCGAEYGMLGTKYLIQSYAVNPTCVVVGAPTQLRLGIRHKGSGLYRINVGYSVIERGARGFNRKVILHAEGKTGSNSTTEVGRNAIETILTFLANVKEAGFDFKLTKLTGGESQNRIPDIADAEVYLNSHQIEDFKRFLKDFVSKLEHSGDLAMETGAIEDTGIRFLPDDLFEGIQTCLRSIDQLRDEFKNQVDNGFSITHSTISLSQIRQLHGKTELYLDIRFVPKFFDEQRKKIRSLLNVAIQEHPAFNFAVDKIYDTKPIDQTDKDWIKECDAILSKTDIQPRKYHLDFSSEAGLFHDKGYPTVAFGPGKMNQNAQSPNEKVSLKEIEKAIEFYKNVIETICG